MHLTRAQVRDYRSAASAHREGSRWLHLAMLNAGLFTRSGSSFFLSSAMDVATVERAVLSDNVLRDVRKQQHAVFVPFVPAPDDQAGEAQSAG